MLFRSGSVLQLRILNTQFVRKDWVLQRSTILFPDRLCDYLNMLLAILTVRSYRSQLHCARKLEDCSKVIRVNKGTLSKFSSSSVILDHYNPAIPYVIRISSVLLKVRLIKLEHHNHLWFIASKSHKAKI